MKLLVIGKPNNEINTAIEIANKRGAKIILAESADQGFNYVLSGKGTDLVLISTDMDISFLSTEFKNAKISTPIIAYGVQVSPKDAVKAIKSGAKEFLPLPPDEKLIAAILTAISDDSVKVIGESKAIKNSIAIADKIAASDASILITGQSGTGKEVFAKYIHSKSKRKDKGFVSVNCAAIPENLLESELFGHEKGAFTGAFARRIGKFEESSGGTLLLDEISEMDVRLQAKLLRAIQEKEIDRVGGSSPIKVDLRIIATSNRDLKQEIAKGNFREDLFFRLNIINIELPALLDREDDLKLLANFFAEKYCKNNNIAIKKLSDAAYLKMKEYTWPGNVRELENIMHRAVLFAQNDEINPEDITVQNAVSTHQMGAEKERITSHTVANNAHSSTHEKQMIFSTLGYCLGDLNKTANILGISINILQDKLKKYSLEN